MGRPTDSVWNKPNHQNSRFAQKSKNYNILGPNQMLELMGSYKIKVWLEGNKVNIIFLSIWSYAKYDFLGTFQPKNKLKFWKMKS